MTDRNPNSMTYWWPLVLPLRQQVPMPETRIIDIGWKALLAVLDGEPTPWLPDVVAAAREIGCPVFMRTDLCSAKHGFEGTCYIGTPADIGRNIFSLVEETVCNWLDPCAIAIREYLPPVYSFTAFRGLPVGRERRHFVEDGRVLCRHPYWPEEAIEPGRPDNPAWRDLLRGASEETVEESGLLTQYACALSGALPGAWSVDFMCTERGWFFIDCALAKDSWHPEHEAVIPCE